MKKALAFFLNTLTLGLNAVPALCPDFPEDDPHIMEVCPEVVTIAVGGGVTHNAASITVTNTLGVGINYQTTFAGTCATNGEKTNLEVTSPTGHTDTSNDQTVSVGDNSIDVDSLAEVTAYCVYVANVSNRGTRSYVKSSDFTTVEDISGGGEAVAGRFFNASTGDDDNSGLSDTEAWLTIAKLDSVSLPIGTDIWLHSGHEWFIPAGLGIDVDWGCTSSDRCVVGTYYMVSDVETRGYAGCGGDCDDAVDPGDPYTAQTTWLGGTLYGAYPTGFTDDPKSMKYRPLFKASSPYVTFENVNCWKSQGRCIEVDEESGHVVVDNVMSHISGGAALVLDKDKIDFNNPDGGYSVVKNSYFSENGRCYGTVDGSWTGGTGAISAANHCTGYTAGVTAVTSSFNLFENNIISKAAGEGLSIFAEAENNTFRGNTVMWTRSLCLYANASADNIFENNICLGGAAARGTDAQQWYRVVENGVYDNNGSCLNLNYENSANSIYTEYKGTGNIFRNNICIGFSTGIVYSAGSTARANDNEWVGAEFTGNTFLYNTGKFVDTSRSLSDHPKSFGPNAGSIKINNNIFGLAIPYYQGLDNTDVISHSTVEIDWNATEEAFTDTDMIGANDPAVGSAGFASAPFSAPSPDSPINIYDHTDVCLGASSTFKGDGSPTSFSTGISSNYIEGTTRPSTGMNPGATVDC